MAARNGSARDKVFLVTGANAGIGRAAVERLAAAGGTVLLVCRDRARCDAARREVVTRTGNTRVETATADLSSQQQVRHLAEEVRRRFGRLDVLVNNAGVITRGREVTEDGLERQFAVNHLAPFLLTRLLLPLLTASAPARIITVASEAHREGRIDFDDLQGAKRYRALRAYRQSKLANILFTRELARQLQGTGVTANALHPGVVASKLLFGGWKIARLARPFLKTPEEGAETMIYLALSPDVAGVSGQYFIDCQPADPSRRAQDPETTRRLWEVSEELTSRSG